MCKIELKVLTQLTLEKILHITENSVPIANVINQMLRTIPNHGEIAGDAILLIHQCVSMFISLLTSKVNSLCPEEWATITAEDVLIALNKLGFYGYIKPLFIYLNRFREFEGREGSSLRGQPLGMGRPLQPGAMGIAGAFGAMRIADAEPGSNVEGVIASGSAASTTGET